LIIFHIISGINFGLLITYFKQHHPSGVVFFYPHN